MPIQERANIHIEWTMDWAWGRLTSRSWCLIHPLSVWGTPQAAHQTQVTPFERALAQGRKCCRVQSPGVAPLLFAPASFWEIALLVSRHDLILWRISPSLRVPRCQTSAGNSTMAHLAAVRFFCRESFKCLSSVQTVYISLFLCYSCPSFRFHPTWVPPWFSQKAFTSPSV